MLAGWPEQARLYADLSLEHSGGLNPFHRAYAHEARARAAFALGDDGAAATHLNTAHALASQVEDPRDRALLEADLMRLGR